MKYSFQGCGLKNFNKKQKVLKTQGFQAIIGYLCGLGKPKPYGGWLFYATAEKPQVNYPPFRLNYI